MQFRTFFVRVLLGLSGTRSADFCAEVPDDGPIWRPNTAECEVNLSNDPNVSTANE